MITWLTLKGMLRNVLSTRSISSMRRSDCWSIESQFFLTTTLRTKLTTPSLPSSSKDSFALFRRSFCWIDSNYFSWSMFSKSQSGNMRVTWYLFVVASLSLCCTFPSRKIRVVWWRTCRSICCSVLTMRRDRLMISPTRESIISFWNL